MSTRIDKIRSTFDKQKIGALFITGQENVSYLTGFAGLSPNEREGYLFVTLETAVLLTFPTYFGLYEKGGSGFTTHCITQTKRLSDHLGEIIAGEKIKTAGFEKDNLTVAELESLKSKLHINWTETAGTVEKFRIVKDDSEIQNIKKAAKTTDLAFDFIRSKIKPGASEKELALELEFFLKKNAGDIAFPPIVAFGENAAIPHYLPSHNSQLTTHNLILLDFGAKTAGYCADMTRVVFFGAPKDEWVKVYDTVLNAQKLALSALKPGTAAGLPDKIAKDYIKSRGFPDYPHGLGHGVGLAIHEAPKLRTDSQEVLAENMAVTVEPGIYLPGDCGVRIEDLVVLRKDGIEILSKSPKSLKELIIL